jgi:hypothetical protein
MDPVIEIWLPASLSVASSSTASPTSSMQEHKGADQDRATLDAGADPDGASATLCASAEEVAAMACAGSMERRHLVANVDDLPTASVFEEDAH